MAHIQFKLYRVEEMAFRINDQAAADRNHFRINPQIRVDIKLEKENYFLIMTAKVESTADNPTPFDFSVKLFSHFAITEKTDIETLRKEGCLYIYPYMRSTVTSVISAANMPPYFMPIIDFEMQKSVKEEATGEGEGIKLTPLVGDEDL